MYPILSLTAGVAAIAGAITGSFTMKWGRRKTFIISMCICIFGNIWKQWVTYWTFQVATCVLAFGGGMFTVLAPRYVEEIVLNKDFTFCMAWTHLVQSLAEFLGSLMTNILPPQEDDYAIYFDHNFHWILGMNLIYCIITLMMLFLILDHETPKFYLSIGEEEKALKTLQVY